MKNFDVLRQKMSLAAQKRAEKKTAKLIRDMEKGAKRKK